MFVRKFSAAVGATAMVAAGIAGAVVSPAQADPAGPPTATDLVGAGSDTTQLLMGALADDYNAVEANAGHKLVSYDACLLPQGQYYPCDVPPSNPPAPESDPNKARDYITLAGGTLAIRPNGSGAGIKTLYTGTGAVDNPKIAFARSSGGTAQAYVDAKLTFLPYAVDKLEIATAETTNAPADLPASAILSIYNGNTKHWGDIPGYQGPGAALSGSATNATYQTDAYLIHAYYPQSNSGTYGFFTAQLGKISGASNSSADYSNGHSSAWNGTDYTGASIQEHDPTSLKNDPNAIAPFSVARAGLINSGTATVRKGSSTWEPARAVYNVLRTQAVGADNANWIASSPLMKSIFGPDGYLCSPDAEATIEAQGFFQLKRVADGGACGVGSDTVGQSPALDAYTIGGGKGAPRAGGSAVTAAYGTSHVVSLQVKGLTGASTPTGAATLKLAGKTYTADLDATGLAKVTLPATLAVGSYTGAVSYTGNDVYEAASGSVRVTITKAKATLKVTAPKSVKKKAKSVKVTVAVSPKAATGTVTVKKGAKVVGTAKVSGGKASITIKKSKLKKGKNALSVSLSGPNYTAAAKSVTIKVS